MPETPMAQYDKRLGQREGSEAVEGRPSAHVLFVALGDSSVQPEHIVVAVDLVAHA